MRNLLLACTALAAVSCAGIMQPAAPPAGKASIGAWGFDLGGMDASVKPGDNFFSHANGKWFASTEIPADRASWGSFQQLRVLSENRMKEIVKELEAKDAASLNEEERKLRDLYDGFVDTKAIDAAGLAPAKEDLDYFAGLTTPEDVARASVSITHSGSGPFGMFIGTDAKNSNAYAVVITQGGLGMPNRDYYLKDDAALKETRDAYRKYLATMLRLSGARNAEKRANAVFALETDIAKAHWPAAERRNAEKVYNPMTLSELETLAPDFAWKAAFEEIGVSGDGPEGPRKFIVRENTAFPALAKLVKSTPIAVWRDYLTVQYLHDMAPVLPSAFDAADFNFYGKVIGGQSEQLARDTRGVQLLDARLGHPLGKLYVTRYFPPDAKAKAEKLVGNLLKAYEADIRTLDWMTPETRQKALDKLHAFTPHIGYPDKWRDYAGLEISRTDLIGNIERSDLFEWKYRLNRLDQPTNRHEWGMTPPTVNAYYTAAFNGIFFPASILQPPFFDPNADDAVNYGGIGTVIGHEISHGFDDQGSKYDGAGILRSWWTEADRKAFEERTAKLGAQYETYEPLPGMHINGKLTMGENIADLAGASIAHKAYHISLKGKTPPVLDGFTGDQRFFLSFGQIWRGKYRDAAMRQQVLSNPHSPPEFRAIGPTRNIDAWYSIFGVKEGEKYYLAPKDRVRLW